jgi:adenylate kinase
MVSIPNPQCTLTYYRNLFITITRPLTEQPQQIIGELTECITLQGCGTTKFDKTAGEQFNKPEPWEVKNFTKAILVTGTPGVGKTTVSHKLATKLDARYLSVTELVKEQQLIIGVDENRQTLIADTEKTSKQLQYILAKTEDTIIIEGHYAVDIIPNKDVNTVFVLRRDPRELKNTLEKRGYQKKKLWENLAAEILDVCLWDALSACGADKVCEIDVSGKTVEAVAEEMTMVLEKRQECRHGIVDWLGKLENEGQLEEFLKNF